MTRTLVALLVMTALTGACAPGDEPGAQDEADMPAAADTPASTGERDTMSAERAQAVTVTVFFSSGDSVVAVSRPRPASAGANELAAALRLLLRGPTEAERAAGLHSWFSAETAGALRSAAVDDDGHAVVDFENLRDLIPNASTSAGSAMLLRELNATVFAVPSVASVEYRIEGSCDRFWEWLQYGCEVVARS